MSVLVEAERRAAKLYPRSKGHRSAYMAGARAAEAGKTTRTNPYRAGGWRLAWGRGHYSVASG